jgi:hypothetical protein
VAGPADAAGLCNEKTSAKLVAGVVAAVLADVLVLQPIRTAAGEACGLVIEDFDWLG